MASPTTVDTVPAPRRLILCFDGTGNKFGEKVCNIPSEAQSLSFANKNSNVVRFFHALVKDRPEEQLVYYQPGIGTYNTRQFLTRTVSTIASAIDQGVALHLSDHVKEGYQYIMRNYRKGDKICLFGFSRGAHTARVVAGMLYKIGVLPADNDQQLDFAFSVYQTTGDLGYSLSKEFKRTFALPVTVEFVGVWDTVSSVGIIPRAHPYTSVNYAVKHFRHALALDERRARFRPNVWHEPTLEREQELDVDEPDVKFPDPKDRDNWVYEAPDRDLCDVQEVWFSGCHADVGGGSHDNTIQESLSYIPLRWMIKECYLTKTGILFDQEYLKDLGFDLVEFAHDLKKGSLDIKSLGFDLEALEAEKKEAEKHHKYETPPPDAVAQSHDHNGPIYNIFLRAKAHRDMLATVWDQLYLTKAWWILEVIPMLSTHQEENGEWVRQRMRNFGQGRYIHFFEEKVKVHVSVKERIKETRKPGNEKYTPSAFNWETVVNSGMLEWVK